MHRIDNGLALNAGETRHANPCVAIVQDHFGLGNALHAHRAETVSWTHRAGFRPPQTDGRHAQSTLMPSKPAGVRPVWRVCRPPVLRWGRAALARHAGTACTASVRAKVPSAMHNGSCGSWRHPDHIHLQGHLGLLLAGLELQSHPTAGWAVQSRACSHTAPDRRRNQTH
jgi:hypothetical protein